MSLFITKHPLLTGHVPPSSSGFYFTSTYFLHSHSLYICSLPCLYVCLSVNLPVLLSPWHTMAVQHLSSLQFLQLWLKTFFGVCGSVSLTLSFPLLTLSIQSISTSLLQQWNLVANHAHALKQFLFSSIMNSLFIICPCLLFPFFPIMNHWPESVLAVAVTLSHVLKNANLLFCQLSKYLF